LKGSVYLNSGTVCFFVGYSNKCFKHQKFIYVFDSSLAVEYLLTLYNLAVNDDFLALNDRIMPQWLPLQVMNVAFRANKIPFAERRRSTFVYSTTASKRQFCCAHKSEMEFSA
jgi:hypothetical protein